MTKATMNRTQKIILTAAVAVTYLLPGCGHEEDLYLEPQRSTSTHSSFQQSSGLAAEDSVIGESNAKYKFKEYPTLELVHPFTLETALGAERLIVDADEITPQGHEPLEELPAPDFWHPEDDQDDSASEAPIIEHNHTPVGTPFNTTRPFDQLTVHEFRLACKAVDHIYDAEDLEAMNAGSCTYDVALQSSDFTRLDENACGRYMNNCLAQHEAFELPIGLCEDPSQTPETCQVNYVQLQSCLQAINATQTALAEENICDTAIEHITRTRVLLNQHNKARQCLTKLESHCPALAPYGVE